MTPAPSSAAAGRAERRRGLEPTGFAYPGRHREQADRVYRLCQWHSMPLERAYALACMASLGEKTWVFQSTVAAFCGICVRTVQRAVKSAKKLGIVIVKRIPRGARPEGAQKRLDCGAAWKKFVAWGLPMAAAVARSWRYAQGYLRHEANLRAWRERQRSELSAAVAEFRSLAPP